MNDPEYDQDDEEIGSVDVRLSRKEVYKAVKNILANEMKLDPVKVREEVRQASFQLIKDTVIAHIDKAGYGTAGLQEWARRAMDARMKDVDKILKEVVKELVAEHLREEVVQVVEAIVTNGLEVRVGWNRKIKVQMKESK